MKRKKPKNGDFCQWDAFEEWADKSGVGTHPDDWADWWDCWKAAFVKAMN